MYLHATIPNNHVSHEKKRFLSDQFVQRDAPLLQKEATYLHSAELMKSVKPCLDL